MKATIWSEHVELPEGFCYNCSAPSTEIVALQSKGGIASSRIAQATLVGGITGALRKGAGLGQIQSATYCARCVIQARRGSFLEGIPIRLLKWYLKPNQTAAGAAFEILNAGKDILNGNRSFVSVRYTNPKVLEGIRRLNPGVKIT